MNQKKVNFFFNLLGFRFKRKTKLNLKMIERGLKQNEDE